MIASNLRLINFLLFIVFVGIKVCRVIMIVVYLRWIEELSVELTFHVVFSERHVILLIVQFQGYHCIVIFLVQIPFRVLGFHRYCHFQ